MADPIARASDPNYTPYRPDDDDPVCNGPNVPTEATVHGAVQGEGAAGANANHETSEATEADDAGECHAPAEVDARHEPPAPACDLPARSPSSRDTSPPLPKRVDPSIDLHAGATGRILHALLPDYVAVSTSVGVGIVNVGITVAVDRYGNVFAGPSLSAGAGMPLSGGASAGLLDKASPVEGTSAVPSREALEGFLTGDSASVEAVAGLGIKKVSSPTGTATEAELGTPQASATFGHAWRLGNLGVRW